MSRRLLIILANTDPRHGPELGVPFYHAAVAAAMDHAVDVVCTAAAGALMRRGVAASLRVDPDDPKTVHDWIREAAGHGARFWACPAQLASSGAGAGDLIPECSGLMGAAEMIQRVMDDDVRVLSY